MTLARILGRPAFWAVVAAVVLVGPLPLGYARGAGVAVAIGSDGSVAVTVSATLSNGSALREAMDGNFAPLVDLLTSNASARASLLGQIALAESTPFLSSLFGNRDGTVQASEVSLFTSLLMQQARLLPAGTLTGGSFFSFTLDGARPSSNSLVSINFGNATGAANSTGPLSLGTSLTYTFAYTGTSHTLGLAANLTQAVSISLITTSVDLAVSVPAGNTITGTTGFSQVSVSNDFWGWGGASASGSVVPTTNGTYSVSYGRSFPTGDVVLIGAPAVVLAVAGLLLWRRRRRRARPPTA